LGSGCKFFQLQETVFFPDEPLILVDIMVKLVARDAQRGISPIRAVEGWIQKGLLESLPEVERGQGEFASQVTFQIPPMETVV
jgi:hypothetical protein